MSTLQPISTEKKQISYSDTAVDPTRSSDPKKSSLAKIAHKTLGNQAMGSSREMPEASIQKPEPLMTSIDIQNYETEMDFIAAINKHGATIEKLSSSKSMSTDVIVDIVEKCPNLRIFSARFESCFFTEGSRDPIVKALVEHCPKLEVFSIVEDGGNFTDESIKSALESFRELKSFTLKGNSIVTDAAIVASLLPPTLTHVNFSNCEEITEETLIYLINNAPPSLESLTFFHCPNILNKRLDAAELKVAPQIKRLDLGESRSNGTELTNISIRKLAQALPSLTHFCVSTLMSRFSDVGIKDLAENCPNLTHVKLYNVWNLSDEGVVALATNCPKLKFLNLSWSGTREKQITDISFIALAENCPELEHLEYIATETLTLTDASIEALASRTKLHTLLLSCAKELSNKSLIALAKAETPLLNLTLSRSGDGITDEGISFLAKKCSSLKKVDLSHCNALTYHAVRKLVQHCQSLTVLHLKGCKLMSDRLADVLQKHATNLKELNIRDCPHISSSFLGDISGHPGLKKLAVGELEDRHSNPDALDEFKTKNPLIKAFGARDL